MSGNWLAHVPDGRNIWSRHGKWIGWFAYAEADVMTPKGKYLGTTGFACESSEVAAPMDLTPEPRFIRGPEVQRPMAP